MDASFDERFTSSFAVPGLPFEGAVRLRHIGTSPQKQVDSTEHTGTSVGPQEAYPTDNDLPAPNYQQTIADITHLSESKRGVRTRKACNEETAIINESDPDNIRAYFVNMEANYEASKPEYLMYVYEISDENKKNTSLQDSTINLSDFLPEPSSLNQVVKTSESVQHRWGVAIAKEIQGLFDNDTFGTNERPLPNDEVVPTKLTLKAKLNSYGGLDKLKARVCF